jgi:diguanylate cyclase (GGDEF)-like protein/putative nucleotidyltransferase with HDIG domain
MDTETNTPARASALTARVKTWTFFASGAVATCVGLLRGVSPLLASDLAALAILGAGASAAGAALRLSRHVIGKEARRWRLLALAATLFASAQVFRLGYQVVRSTAVVDSPVPGILRTAGLLTFVPVVLLMAESFEVLPIRKLRNSLDLASMMVWALVIAQLALITPLEASGMQLTLAEKTLGIAYPVLTAGMVLFLLAFKRNGWTTPDLLVLGAIVSSHVSSILSVRTGALVILGTGSVPSVSADLTAYIAFGLLAASASTRLHLEDRPYRIARPEPDLPHWPGIVSLGLALVGIPLLMFVAHLAPNSSNQLLATVAASALAALVVARSIVITIENARLAEQSLTDPLTGLFNHRHFRDALAGETHLAIRDGEHLTLATFELDGFESVNRRWGYDAGDRVLQTTAQTIRAHVRDSDLCFHLGSDEFAVLMPATGAVEAFVACTRVLEALHARSPVAEPIRASVGVASIPLHTSDAEELRRFSEGAVYWAKSRGGDRAVVFDPQVVDVLDSREHISFLERSLHTQMVEVLAAAVDARDPYTQFHSRNVAAHAEVLARGAGLSEEHVRLVHSAGLLHDVGKIGIPDDILRKTSRLDDEEFERIREHPSLGVRILQASARQEILPWIAAHHERWDGRGYPEALTADRIPFEARILAVCDSFDAMTTDRPYRPALELSEAVAELETNAGTQFDPELVALFTHLLRLGRIDAPPPMSAK